jgi:hypothetical protein
MEIVDELLNLVRTFERAQIAYAVCGGLAVTIHGRPRLTVDIDIVVPKPAMDKAIELAASVGFDMQEGWVPLPKNDLGIDRLFRLTKIERQEFLTLDLLEADSDTNRLFANRERISLGDDEIAVLSKDAIIEMKSRSDRTKDRLDIEMLQDEVD